jgi:hypothetical protein
MTPVIPAEMIQSGFQMVVYFVTVLTAVLSFLISPRV